METVREGLRDENIHRGRYERLTCSKCDIELSLSSDDGEIGTIRVCRGCGTKWREI